LAHNSDTTRTDSSATGHPFSALASILGAEIRLRFRAVLHLPLRLDLGVVPLLVLPG
jgi:hypothetical protein